MDDVDRRNPVFELLDPGAVEAAVRGLDDLSDRATISLYGALTAAVWLGRRELTAPGGPPPPP